MRRVFFMWIISCIGTACYAETHEAISLNPPAIEIADEPQLFVDDYLIDNEWVEFHSTEAVTRVFHRPTKYKSNPVIANQGIYVDVVRDSQTGLFRMWSQCTEDTGKYGVGYAESIDGIHWKAPQIGKYMFNGNLNNNIVLLSADGSSAESQSILDIPREARRGFEYVMLYVTNGLESPGVHLIGSHDGINWDRTSEKAIAARFFPDTQNCIVWNSKRKMFMWFTRALNIYRENRMLTGPHRRIAWMEHAALWDLWPVWTENILLPDALDVKEGIREFYGMPVKYYGGIYWGFLWSFRDEKYLDTQLSFSRDGKTFQRPLERSPLVAQGRESSWDSGMVLGRGWVEVKDQWWIYYAGSDSKHDAESPHFSIGLARIRKEGFASLRSSRDGGVVVTRLLRWPGGTLFVNADAFNGELRVRITGYNRKQIPNTNLHFSLPITGDSVRHEVKWAEGDLSQVKGEAIRLEFQMKGTVDLYGFQALPSKATTN